jgi:hypothetical protein
MDVLKETKTMQAMTTNTSKYVEQVARDLDKLIASLRQNIGNVEEPKAQALFETSAEVLLGLKKAYSDYGAGKEDAWR